MREALVQGPERANLQSARPIKLCHYTLFVTICYGVHYRAEPLPWAPQISPTRRITYTTRVTIGLTFYEYIRTGEDFRRHVGRLEE